MNRAKEHTHDYIEYRLTQISMSSRPSRRRILVQHRAIRQILRLLECPPAERLEDHQQRSQHAKIRDGRRLGARFKDQGNNIF